MNEHAVRDEKAWAAVRNATKEMVEAAVMFPNGTIAKARGTSIDAIVKMAREERPDMFVFAVFDGHAFYVFDFRE